MIDVRERYPSSTLLQEGAVPQPLAPAQTQVKGRDGSQLPGADTPASLLCQARLWDREAECWVLAVLFSEATWGH